ncbi:MAG: hypothetical protein Q9220_005688 [cf. Caloplaca sp. 1 TL-2023]
MFVPLSVAKRAACCPTLLQSLVKSVVAPGKRLSTICKAFALILDSPEDQAMLEAAFKENPKPDKLARAEILKRVNLGEKELAELSSSQSSATPHTSQTSEASQSTIVLTEDRHTIMMKAEGQDALPTSEGDSQKPNSNPLSAPDVQHTGNPALPISMPNTDASSTSTSTSTLASNDLLSSKLKFPKFPKKQRNTPFILFDESDPRPDTLPPTLPTLKHTTSQPRLSTSLDGSVRITTGASPTPSPPRPLSSLYTRHSRPSGSLQRSQSAIVAPTFPVPRSRAPIGRSRDSRTWEFYCDSDARDELTKQAEREQSGSALGAIGLIRSRSNASLSSSTALSRNATTNPNKRNAIPTSKSAESPKRLKAAKPKLERATSSVARLQNGTSMSNTKANVSKTALPAATKSITATHKHKSSSYLDLLDQLNDSDKENWTPGTQISVSPHRHARQRVHDNGILVENAFIPSHSSSLDVLMSASGGGNKGSRKGAKMGESGPTRGKENDQTGLGGEAVEGGVVEEEGDLDCVQGLLKLSRGAWR